MLRLVAMAVALPLVAACGVGESDTDSLPSMDEVVAAVSGVPSVDKVVRLTADDDPNELLGRPDGYDHAAVFHDSRLDCRSPGIDCGAFLEVWDDAAEAEARSGEIKALQDGMQMLGTERHYVRGAMLLRVSGDLRPRAAQEYARALAG